MPIETPGKRWGKRLQKSKVFGHGHHGKKSGFADLLITPLVDMFVIIVLFLIANFSATGEVLNMRSDIQLPEAINVKDIEAVPVILVSKEMVIVDGNVLGNVPDLLKDASDLEMPALQEKLREMKKQYVDLHTAAKDEAGAFKGDINIQATRDVEFKVIKKVMYSCAVAGYANINFAVLTKGASGAEGVGGPVTVHTP